ncbi:hypothetical protein J7K41_03915 [Candidatus Micrarchaeota archaeon]|nr:hypothetical protein [Candidatus Micrarchaeota archaeon]
MSRKRSVLHDPIVDNQLYSTDLHVHTQRLIYVGNERAEYFGSYDAYIDPLDFIHLIRELNHPKPVIKVIGFVDHDTVLPSFVQNEIKIAEEDNMLDIHYGMETTAVVTYQRNRETKRKRVHLIMYDLPAEEREVQTFITNLNVRHKELLKLMFNEFCMFRRLHIITPEELYRKFGYSMDDVLHSKHVPRYSRLLAKLSDDEYESMVDRKIESFVRGSDIYGSLLRFVHEIWTHPKNLEYFIKDKRIKSEKDLINLLINNFKEMIDASFIDAEHVIAFSKRMGSPVVLAHPGKSKVREEVIHTLIDQGLSGIEVIHPDNRVRCKELMMMARRRKVGITVGSDFHGDKNPKRNFDKYQRVIKKLHVMINRVRKYNNELKKTPDQFINNPHRRHKKFKKKI